MQLEAKNRTRLRLVEWDRMQLEKLFLLWGWTLRLLVERKEEKEFWDFETCETVTLFE